MSFYGSILYSLMVIYMIQVSHRASAKKEECEGDLVYKFCGSACEGFCGHLPRMCIKICVPGCYCPRGQTASTLGSTTCIKDEDCKAILLDEGCVDCHNDRKMCCRFGNGTSVCELPENCQPYQKGVEQRIKESIGGFNKQKEVQCMKEGEIHCLKSLSQQDPQGLCCNGLKCMTFDPYLLPSRCVKDNSETKGRSLQGIKEGEKDEEETEVLSDESEEDVKINLNINLNRED